MVGFFFFSNLSKPASTPGGHYCPADAEWPEILVHSKKLTGPELSTQLWKDAGCGSHIAQENNRRGPSPSLSSPPPTAKREVRVLPGLIQRGHFDTKRLLGLCKTTPLQSENQLPETSSANVT